MIVAQLHAIDSKFAAVTVLGRWKSRIWKTYTTAGVATWYLPMLSVALIMKRDIQLSLGNQAAQSMIADRGMLDFSGPSDEEAQATTLVRRFQHYGRNRNPRASEGGQ